MAACVGCLGDQRCWVCLGTGLIEARDGSLHSCPTCSGTGECTHCQRQSPTTRTGLIAEDQRTHVVTSAPGGTEVALCGLGTIIRRLPGKFQPGDRLNCPRCEELAA